MSLMDFWWQGRSYVLPDVWIRPPFGGKGRKVTGSLESHANGFRYHNPKGEQLDIMYRSAILHHSSSPIEITFCPASIQTLSLVADSWYKVCALRYVHCALCWRCLLV